MKYTNTMLNSHVSCSMMFMTICNTCANLVSTNCFSAYFISSSMISAYHCVHRINEHTLERGKRIIMQVLTSVCILGRPATIPVIARTKLRSTFTPISWIRTCSNLVMRSKYRSNIVHANIQTIFLYSLYLSRVFRPS